MTDSERLEWLVNAKGTINIQETVNGYSVFDVSDGLALLGEHVDFRLALDQAMKGGGECLFSRPTVS